MDDKAELSPQSNPYQPIINFLITPTRYRKVKAMKHRYKIYAIFFLIIIGFIILTSETFEERVFFSSNRGDLPHSSIIILQARAGFLRESFMHCREKLRDSDP